MVTENTKKKQWILFLCYSPADKEFVDWLYNRLTKEGFTVWYDKKEILTGESISESHRRGIEGSEYSIIIISEEALRTKWVGSIVMTNIYINIEEQQNYILPVILEGTDTRNLPFFLKDKKRIQFPRSGSEEPFLELLADIRKLREGSSIGAQSELENPFGWRGAIEPRLFVVTENLDKITRDIVAKNSVFIAGACMTGKSSLLKFLASPYYTRHYKERNNNIELRLTYFNLQEHIHKSLDDLLFELANAMSITYGIKKKSRKEALARIKEIAGKKEVGNPFSVLLLDAFDRITDFKGLEPALFDNLYTLAQEYNVCFVIASRINADDLSLPQSIGTSQFINLLHKHSLDVWSSHATQKLMFEPYGKILNIFRESDLVSMANLTARHPFLLQMGCFHLFEAKKGKDVFDLDPEKYLDDTESFYRHYLRYEISERERQWLLDCWKASTQKGQNAQDKLQKLTLGQTNRNIRKKLVKLGLILNKPEALEIPKGLEAFFERTENN